MQFNQSSTFAPRGHQAQMYPAHLEERSSEAQDLASSATLTPRLSYASTPESHFSSSIYRQNPRNNQNTAIRSTTTDNGRRFVSSMEEPMFTTFPGAGTNFYNTVKREIDSSPLDDWLSEPSPSHSWLESPSIQATPFSSRQSIHSNRIPHAQFTEPYPLNNETEVFPPVQVYALNHCGTVHSHASTGNLENPNSNDLFMPPTACGEVNPFHMNDHGFPSGIASSNYAAHGQPIHTGFDFNTSPWYSTTQPSTGAFCLPFPQAAHTLSSQSNTAFYTGQEANKNKDRPKASDLDELLLKWRAQDVTYKDIMKRGDWGLSESTLRGRYRTLTKDKKLRPRKPTWDNAAVGHILNHH